MFCVFILQNCIKCCHRRHIVSFFFEQAKVCVFFRRSYKSALVSLWRLRFDQKTLQRHCPVFPGIRDFISGRFACVWAGCHRFRITKVTKVADRAVSDRIIYSVSVKFGSEEGHLIILFRLWETMRSLCT